MNQVDLDRAVAAKLGEPVRTIARRGFSLLTDSFEEREPLVLDFDDVTNPVALPLVESMC
ncbi:MAG: hypothetical protein RIC55_09520 [Pirellulaceae bacterium]